MAIFQSDRSDFDLLAGCYVGARSCRKVAGGLSGGAIGGRQAS
jgi:hypothetical protein